MKTIEIVVPCYNEEECIQILFGRIDKLFAQLKDYKYIISYIDDGSRDNTMKRIKELVSINKSEKGRVQYISLSRNFGKESAIYAGLSKSVGDYVAIMDADLQHPPELLLQMIDAIENEDYDCATAKRVARKKESIFRRKFSSLFFKIITRLTAVDLSAGSTDYRLMKRGVVEAIVSMTEHERFTKGIYAWVGFKNKIIEYQDVERAAGTTTWNYKGLISYAYTGFVAFATTPLRGVVYFGLMVVLITFVMAMKVLINAICYPQQNGSGFTTIILLIMFFSGVIIFILGMIGEYLARIYMEVKNRPIFFTRETNIGHDKLDEMVKEEKIVS